MTDDATESGGSSSVSGETPKPAPAVDTSASAPTQDPVASAAGGGDATPAGDAGSASAEHATRIARAEKLRAAARTLLAEIQPGLESEHLLQASALLNLARDGALIYPQELVGPVLIDFCLFNMLRKGRNAIQTYAEDKARAGVVLEGGSGEVLEGLLHARYSVIGITEVTPGRLIKARDLYYERSIEIYDEGLAASAARGLVLATRLVPLGDFEMLAGGALPITMEVAFLLVRSLSPLLGKNWLRNLGSLGPEKQRDMVVHIIRQAITTGALKRIRYDGDAAD